MINLSLPWILPFILFLFLFAPIVSISLYSTPTSSIVIIIFTYVGQSHVIRLGIYNILVYEEFGTRLLITYTMDIGDMID
jgi:hypothetical protein